MDDRPSNILAGVCGIVAVLAANVAFFAIVGATPGMGASTQDISDFLARSSTRIYGGGYIEIVAFPLILVFLGRLRELLRRAEGENGWLATTAYGAALIAIGFGAVAFTAEATAYYAGRRGLDLKTVGALLDLDGFAFVIQGMPLAIFLGATAVLALRAHALPRWLGWSAATIAILFPATLWSPTDLAQLPHPLFYVWVVATSVVLIARREEPSLAMAKPAASV
jgi:hypothetical protein